MCLENDHRLPTEQRFAPPIVEEAGNTPVLETVNNNTENPDTALDLNLRPIHFQRGALGGSAESLDTSTDPSRDEDVEVMEVKPHPRILERVSARYAARTGAPPPSVAGKSVTAKPGSRMTPPPLSPMGGHMWTKPGKDGVQWPTEM